MLIYLLYIKREIMKATPQPLIRVAYAEDHHLVRVALSEQLEQTGSIKVMLSVADGAALIEGIRRSPHLPHVCLLDIEMPVMNGFEATKALKKQWPSIKILALTGYDTELYQIKMLQCGVDAFLLKRTSHSELIKAITALYNEEIYHSGLFERNAPVLNKKTGKAINLTPMEEWLLKVCGEDKTLKELGDLLHFSSKQIEMCRYHLYQKIGVKNRAGMLMYAIRNGYVSIP